MKGRAQRPPFEDDPILVANRFEIYAVGNEGTYPRFKIVTRSDIFFAIRSKANVNPLRRRLASVVFSRQSLT